MAAVSPAPDGLIAVKSPWDFEKTVANLLIALERRGMTFYARVDHAANAAGAGLELGPTQLFIFDIPEVESAILSLMPAMGLEFPRRIAVWRNQQDEVFLGYDDPLWLAQRYSASREAEALLAAVATSQQGIVLEAATAIEIMGEARAK
jgi:uncharacterized protein (DUF302 family)